MVWARQSQLQEEGAGPPSSQTWLAVSSPTHAPEFHSDRELSPACVGAVGALCMNSTAFVKVCRARGGNRGCWDKEAERVREGRWVPGRNSGVALMDRGREKGESREGPAPGVGPRELGIPGLGLAFLFKETGNLRTGADGMK